jgi:hypothetical protein
LHISEIASQQGQKRVDKRASWVYNLCRAFYVESSHIVSHPLTTSIFAKSSTPSVERDCLRTIPRARLLPLPGGAALFLFGGAE